MRVDTEAATTVFMAQMLLVILSGTINNFCVGRSPGRLKKRKRKKDGLNNTKSLLFLTRQAFSMRHEKKMTVIKPKSFYECSHFVSF